MPAGTNLDAIYNALGAIVASSTGRLWWDKRKIQAQPTNPYATIYITVGDGLQMPVTENVLLSTPGPNGETFKQYPWGTVLLDVQVEFLRSNPATGDYAQRAAKRFENALRLTEREYDLWLICGLSGAIRYIDISAIFRADVQPQARVAFRLLANLMDQPLAGVDIFDIENQPMVITEIMEDGEEQIINETFTNIKGV